MTRRPLLLLIPFLLSGCVAAAVGAGTEAGMSLAEERSLGTKVDDTTIYADVNRLYWRANDRDLFPSVTVDVRHARVLLTGNVNKPETVQKAVDLAWQAKGVEEVLNEINVAPGWNVEQVAEDTLVKKNLEGRLLITKNVWVINYSISVVNGTAYLLGRVHDQAELDRVLNIARTTRGVNKVVNYLQIRAQNDPVHPAMAPAGSPPPATSSKPPVYHSAPMPAPAAHSGPVGGDGYAAPQLIQSRDLK